MNFESVGCIRSFLQDSTDEGREHAEARARKERNHGSEPGVARGSNDDTAMEGLEVQ